MLTMSGVDGSFKVLGDVTFASEFSSWRVNLLFFFLTASQVTLWPWIPVILVQSGLSRTESGFALATLILVSTISVGLSLKSLKKTRSGAIRRCFIFAACFLGFVFGLAALLVTPGNETFCGHVNTFRHVSYPQKTNIHEHVSNPFDENNHPTITHAHIQNSGMPSKKYKKTENVNKEKNPKIININKKFEHPINHSLKNKQPVYHDSSKASKIEQVNGTAKGNNIKISKTPTEQSKFSPLETDVLKTTKSLKTPTKKAQETLKFPKISNDNPEVVPNSQIDQMHKDNIVQHHISPDISSSQTDPIQNDDSHVGNNSHIISDSQTENVHEAHSKSHHNSHIIPSSQRDHIHNKEIVQPLKERYPLGSLNNFYQESDFSSYPRNAIPSIEDKSSELRINKLKGIDAKRSKHKIIPSPYSPYSRFQKNNNFDYRYYIKDPHKRGHKDYYYARAEQAYDLSPIPYEASETARGLPAMTRHRRSINSQSGLDQNVPVHTKESKNKMSSKKLKIPPGKSESFGWGVFSLFMFMAIFSGGIEISLTKLWHCVVHGVPHDRSSIDGIEATISPNFRPPYLGAHRGWTLITSALWIIVPTVFVSVSCEMEIPVYSPFRMFAMFFVICGVLKSILIWFIPVPYGNVSIPKSSRPLSLYLDDEVIQEGLRRIGFHSWVLLMGLFISLPQLYTMWLLQEFNLSNTMLLVSQTVSLILMLVGEAILGLSEKWISRSFNTQTIMCMCGVSAFIQNSMVWSTNHVWLHSTSTLFIGFSIALQWISVKENALLLGTSVDQEHESWISWIAWRCGLSSGAALWAGLSDLSSDSLRSIFLMSAVSVILCTIIVGLVAACTRTKGKRRRRVYHTLDLHFISDEDSDDSEVIHEPDWLVKRAKKEGMKL